MSNPCRACTSSATYEVLDFGDLAFTGVFPLPGEAVPKGRLALMVCDDCGLVQLGDEFPPDVLYGENYGYRSGLNAGMVAHLHRTVARLERMVDMSRATVLDIGSNDGTLLGAYTTPQLTRIGIDPTSAKFAEFHDPGMVAVEKFFSADAYWDVSNRPARVVTSIAMFYDLPDPICFAKDVFRVMETDGLWHIEVAYAPRMLRSGAYDGICHEHLEYYSLSTLAFILAEAGFRIVSATTNSTNGGSIAVTAAKAVSRRWQPDTVMVPWLMEMEKRDRVGDPLSWAPFAEKVKDSQFMLRELLTGLRASGARVSGLGASTKGNVLLQTTGLGPSIIESIGDVNPYKYGRITPGTRIPIKSEDHVVMTQPDYLLVLPWHFREGITRNMRGYLDQGGKLIFPLPDIEVVGA